MRFDETPLIARFPPFSDFPLGALLLSSLVGPLYIHVLGHISLNDKVSNFYTQFYASDRKVSNIWLLAHFLK